MSSVFSKGPFAPRDPMGASELEESQRAIMVATEGRGSEN